MPAVTETIFELDLGKPTPELLQWAKENIREDPDTKCQIIDEFREMIYSRGDCIPHRMDDVFLLRFLRSRKFSLEAAYKLIVNYYKFQEENPTCIKGVGLEILTRAGTYDVIGVPPYTDQAGRRILLYKIAKWEPENFTIDEVISASWMILELAVLEASAQIRGGICIVDCADITMQQVLYMTPSIARKLVQLAVTSHPMKLEAMHVVNQSWMFEAVFNTVKPFLHEKMRQRLFFHGNNMESLHKHVDPKCLPDIYGGMRPHYSYCDWIKAFRKNKTLLRELQSVGYSISESDYQE